MSRRNPADTPLMRQFREIKTAHPDGILFFRMGDFYEMFFEDAVVAAEALDLTLTSRDKGKADAVPMCGLPHHAARGYVARLTEKGFTVVICEQVEDPKTAKGLVKRAVVQIVTPGVVVDDEVLQAKEARYVAAVVPEASGPRWGLAYLDVSTGEFRATALDSLEELSAELCRVSAREILVAETSTEPGTGALTRLKKRMPDPAYTKVSPQDLDEAARLIATALATDLSALGLEDVPFAAIAAANVLRYARGTQPTGRLPVTRLQVYKSTDTMALDDVAVANLELTQTIVGGKKQGSLLSVIDQTRTALGGRLLRRWLLFPLVHVEKIQDRQDSVRFLVEHSGVRSDLRQQLEGIYDLERLAGRVSLGVATPRDLGRLSRSLQLLPSLASLLTLDDGKGPHLLQLNRCSLEKVETLASRLADALVDEPPAAVKAGGVICEGYCSLLDEQRRLAAGAEDEVRAIEERERLSTNIANLRVKHNRVFGYYIEVGRAYSDNVPAHYVRKQTVAAAERYVTPELADLESRILAAQEAVFERETELFTQLCELAREHVSTILELAQEVATMDVLAGLGELAHTRGYVCPVVDAKERIDIQDGRHPVIEEFLEEGTYVPNSCCVDTEANQLLLITGPNMAGKSTYMRQVAQIVILAQIGSFVPASAAHVGIVDRVFTRVGAADNLSKGDSTFMVEMRETSTILGQATRRSLILLDEVGRGTSTLDGVSIAWAVTEYIHDAIGARTLFATHYHELTRLSQTRPRVKNFSVAVQECESGIVFLRQVVPGGTNKSYGIDVARLAGLPRSVVARSRQVLGELERGQLEQGGQSEPAQALQSVVTTTDDTEELCAKLDAIDPQRITPIEAICLLAELKALYTN